MLHKQKDNPVNGTIILLLVIASVLFLKVEYIQNGNWHWGLLITLLLLLVAYLCRFKHTKNVEDTPEVVTQFDQQAESMEQDFSDNVLRCNSIVHHLN